MATLRKGKCYTKVVRPYTRKSKVKAKNYIKSIPTNKIVRYDIGELTKKFKYEVNLISKQNIQIRHNAIESARLVANRRLHTKLGPKNYHFKIMIYPHHILRENKMLSGAHADRLQSGMKHAFGKPVGLAAQVKSGKVVFSTRVDENGLKIAREAIKTTIPRLPGKFTIEIKKII